MLYRLLAAPSRISCSLFLSEHDHSEHIICPNLERRARLSSSPTQGLMSSSIRSSRKNTMPGRTGATQRKRPRHITDDDESTDSDTMEVVDVAEASSSLQHAKVSCSISPLFSLRAIFGVPVANTISLHSGQNEYESLKRKSRLHGNDAAKMRRLVQKTTATAMMRHPWEGPVLQKTMRGGHTRPRNTN